MAVAKFSSSKSNRRNASNFVIELAKSLMLLLENSFYE